MKLWLRILISAGLFVLLFLLLPWAQVRDALLKLPPGTWAFVLAGFVAGHGVGVFKWRLFVNAGRASGLGTDLGPRAVHGRVVGARPRPGRAAPSTRVSTLTGSARRRVTERRVSR